MTKFLDILIKYANSIVCIFVIIIMTNRVCFIEGEMNVFNLFVQHKQIQIKT